jgi:cardiolipin synthase
VEGYAGLKQLIGQAQRTLYVQTFIFSRDEVAQEILARLTDKASQGVQVCLLVDGLGSLKTRRAFFQPLVRAGGAVAVFKPVVHVPFRGMTNLRNHRKIAVADGCLALAGGMNITAEDMYPHMRPNSWQDLSAIVEGPAARDLENTFRADWRFATGQTIGPGSHDPPPALGESIVQVVPSGPDVPEDPLYCATITAAYRAQRRLWMVTPYFVPDDALAQALLIACRRGVDVRVIVPEKSNHRFSDLAGASFLRDIEAAGGSVLLYTAGMVHAKVMVADDDLAMVGSANLDMRSLFLNYEVMLLCYRREEVAAVAGWIEGLARGCRAGVGQSGFAREMAEGLIRVVSPLF